MKYSYLNESVEIKTVKENDTDGHFIISGLYPGYGLTLANSLRRALLSSLPGAAITSAKIKGIDHEFSTIPGMMEDVIEMSLNLKKIRFILFSDEPQTLSLKIKGEKEVTAADIKINSDVKIVNPNEHIASLTTKSAELDMEITVERGLGYSSVELRKDEKLSIGTIALDAFFSPVIKVNYTIYNIRVGDRTDYNQINIDIVTDSTVRPSAALYKAANILKDHFSKISETFESTKVESHSESKEEEKNESNKDEEEIKKSAKKKKK